VVIPDRLNYPLISITSPTALNSTKPVVVRRTVKNVGEAPSSYYAAIDMPESSVTVVVPEPNQEKSFRVLMWPKINDARVVQGALRWVSNTHTVRSPISITVS
jgi:hypothetical protein